MRILLTGSSGTIGTRLFEELLKQDEVWGVDIRPNRWHPELDAHTIHVDLRRMDELAKLPKDIDLVIHTAAQPSHDWAAKEPFTDFTVNANGTLNLLENARKYAKEAVFILVSDKHLLDFPSLTKHPT